MGRLEKMPDLFANQCAARKDDPLSSHISADKATHTLTEDLRTVLGVLERNDGQTADFLGKQLVMEYYYSERIGLHNLDDIKRLINLPDKKMSKLVALGYVMVEEKPGGNLNWIA